MAPGKFRKSPTREYGGETLICVNAVHVERHFAPPTNPEEAAMNVIGKFSLSAGMCSLLIALTGATAVMAEDQFIGRWKVVSLSLEEYTPDTSSRTIGTAVRGEAVFTAEGRYLLAIMPEQCGPAAADETPVPLIIESGRYRVSGDKLIQEVELASRAALIGATQKQFIDTMDDRVVLESVPTPVDIAGQRQSVTITLQRQK
jgi:Lipocalin-like domain